jgi:hypothetical protein
VVEFIVPGNQRPAVALKWIRRGVDTRSGGTMQRTLLRKHALAGLCIVAAALALLYQARPVLVYHASVAPLVELTPAEAGFL